MGLCGSSMTPEMKQSLENSKKLENITAKDWKVEEKKVKLLLLGAGESGKSTIFKQMKILFGVGGGYQEKDKIQAKQFIYGTILDNMKTVIENCDKYGPLVDSSPLAKFNEVANKEDGRVIDAQLGEVIKSLWNDAGFQKTWHERAEYQVQDALKYYMDNIDRVSANGYIPTEADILRSRVRTTGIQEEHYMIDGVEFVMFDVGGQRNERKKWIHIFDNCTAVIFVAAISEYNQVLYEDNTMNRIDEALALFEEISSSKFFKKTAMILFLNKRDLFAEKLPEYPFRIEGKRFDDFKGPYCEKGTPSGQVGTPEFQKCYDAATKYILDLFLAKNKQGKEIYSHITCATDTKNIEVVFNAFST